MQRADEETVDERPRRANWKRSLLVIFSILGPGFITASAGNDVGGIFTYSVAGAQYGYKIIWTLIPIAVALIVVQEMAARMGAVTGKGLAALIREEFGVWITLLTMLGLFFMNTFTTSAEFAGIASASELFGLSRYIAVPLSLGIVFFSVLRVSGKLVERVFVVLSLVYVTYIVSGLLAHPNWHDVARGAFVPTIDTHDAGYLGTIVALIGTTISPYMQFYLQSAIVEKGTRPNGLLALRIDVVNGSILAIAIAAFMIIASSAEIYVYNASHPAHQITATTAADIAVALRPLAGRFASGLFAFGILNAGLFAAAVLPLSTSYLVCEAFGFEAALDRRFEEAPVFFSLFAIGLVIGAALVLLPGVPLIRLAIASQVVQGLLLPLELVLMLVIINRARVMGSFRNTRTANAICWTTVVIVGVIALYYTFTQVAGAAEPDASPPTAVAAVPVATATPSLTTDPCGGDTRLLATLNRPTVGFSACAVPRGAIVLEEGYQIQSAGGSSPSVLATYPQGFERYGVAQNVEIDLIGPNFNRQRSGFAVTSGTSDLGLGFKYELPQRGRFTYAVDGLFDAATGSRGFTAGSATSTLDVDASYALSPAIGVGTTLAGTTTAAVTASGIAARYGYFLPSIVATVQIPNAYQFYLEFVGQTKLGPGPGGHVFTDFGLQKLVGRNLELDGEYGQSFTPAAGARFRYYGTGIGLRVR